MAGQEGKKVLIMTNSFLKKGAQVNMEFANQIFEVLLKNPTQFDCMYEVSVGPLCRRKVRFYIMHVNIRNTMI
jgi:hypothetical protein